MSSDEKARMPVIFFGHGNPLNAVRRNEWTESWRRIGETIPHPSAIVCVSAHWYIPGSRVTAMENPRTIHDFGGFPRELYTIEYPAPGDRDLATRITKMLEPVEVALDEEWGLDHGTWSILVHAFPDADVPVVQLSIDETRSPDWHFELGRRLARLRDDGVLLIGSGNLVHNLHAYSWGEHPAEPFDWAIEFEERVRDLISSGDFERLTEYESMGNAAMLSIPTPEHFLPLLYVLGAASGGDEQEVVFPVDGIDGGSVSMLSVQIG